MRVYQTMERSVEDEDGPNQTEADKDTNHGTEKALIGIHPAGKRIGPTGNP